MDNILYFRSFPEYFVKEEDGRKPNTLRKLPKDDYRNDIIKKWEDGEKVLIEITDTPDLNSFRREVTDITKWEGWTIISWKHSQVNDKEKQE